MDTRTRGGGVENDFAKFQMYGGSISNNEESQFGGGVGMTAGTMTLTGVVIDGNNPNGGLRGGGIYLSGGALTLINVTIGGEGNAGKNVALRGGGIYVMDGTVKMSRGAISNNTATTAGAGFGGGQGGGGLYVSRGTVALTKVSVNGNGSRFNGGGVYVNGGSLTLNGDSIVNNTTRLNTGGNGGGMFINAGNVTVNGGSISANNAPFGGGNGGGIFNNAVVLTLNASLTFGTPVNIINNSSINGGGGMYLANRSTTNINDSTVSGNTAKTGPGVFEQANARVTSGFPGLKRPGQNPYKSWILFSKRRENLQSCSVTGGFVRACKDNDDPGGKPYNSGIA
jgi:hypothetical protein